ncbi:hypothetical protein [uncultured Nonlabens sp.]|uniref:hypothetical protein n=1 Tax=uncultured Nonlabens sp. TaxID=859306 RepID=UPI0026067CBA|nr:hypothetical protein [uncultured Nonlabens sp.]
MPRILIKSFITGPALLLVFLCSGQSVVKQEGVILDSIGESIASATIIAKGIGHKDFKYASANIDGAYKIDLKKELGYLITIRSIGYITVTDTVQWSENKSIDYILKKSAESLDSILIKARAPINIKGDTTAYRVEYFLTGEERKARDILEKLPGVEVDSRGNVQVSGKDVTTLMVDGKTFFSGDEKLGVNNIPADVIDEIEIIQNYDPIPFMKQLKETEQIALNIKLKEDKKNFVFGDIGLGSGYKENYNTNANLFYYSKKLGINLVSGASNDGKRVFTVEDYIDFEGGTSLLLNNSEKYYELLNSDLSTYLRRDDFEKNTNVVGAVNVVNEVSPRSTITAYSVWLNDKSSFNTLTSRFYPLQNTQEQVESRDNVKALLGLTKLKWQYRKTVRNYWDFSALLRNSFSNSDLNVDSRNSNVSNRFIIKDGDFENYSVELRSSHHAQWSKKSFIEWETVLSKSESDTRNNWNFNQPVFSNLINYEGASNNLFIRQDRITDNNSIDSKLDYYWSINRYSQLNPKFQINYKKENYTSLDGELLNDNYLSFQDDDFNNDLDFTSIIYGTGLDYYKNKGNHSIRLGFMINQYNYSFNNFSDNSTSKNLIRFLPKLEYKITFLKNRKLNFNYSTRAFLPNSSVLANRFRLGNYNSIVQGNESLEEQYLHRSRLTYSSGSREVGHLFFSSINYSYRNQSITSSREFIEIDQISRYVLLNQPNQNFGLSFSSTFLNNNWRFVTKPSYQISLSNDIINGETVQLEINRLKYDLRAISNYNDFINFKIGFNQSYTDYKGFRENSFLNSVLSIELSYDFNDSWIANIDFNQTLFENLSTKNKRSYGVLNFNINYRPKKSQWSFNLSAYNALNVNSRLDSSFSDFIVNDTETFILPFRFVLKTSYNF